MSYCYTLASSKGGILGFTCLFVSVQITKNSKALLKLSSENQTCDNQTNEWTDTNHLFGCY